jgi:demethylmenaquinone methyltransferase/2-methoxy-6-polyprenyl-1,4-benzoquinol methylase
MADTAEADFLDRQQQLFARIAGNYDLINHLMTGWQDRRWRRYAVSKLRLSHSARLLDIGSGNGQVVQEAYRQYPDCRPVAADLTREMMMVGKMRHAEIPTAWAQADSARLPFEGESFQAVISAFLVRNLSDILQGLRDQRRVLQPGGRIVVLDTSRPPQHLLAPLIRFYMNKVIPTLGGLLTGYKAAYHYLNDSTARFLPAEELAACLETAGFRDVAYRKFALGLISVHWGVK